jgi:hypothetical protein
MTTICNIGRYSIEDPDGYRVNIVEPLEASCHNP